MGNVGLIKSFCGGPGGGFLEKSPLVGEGKKVFFHFLVDKKGKIVHTVYMIHKQYLQNRQYVRSMQCLAAQEIG